MENETDKELTEVEKLLLLLDDIESKERYEALTHKIEEMYPDQGEFAREMYPKHIAFFNAPTRERLFIAGNRCITPHTTVTTGSAHPLSALDALKKFCDGDLTLQSWDGEKKCSQTVSDAFLVGFAPTYRLVLDNGDSIECSAGHFLASDQGFQPLASIVSGQQMPWTIGRLPNSQASCGTYTHPNDKSAHLYQGHGSSSLPEAISARLYTLLNESVDETERTQALDRLNQDCVRLSTKEGLQVLSQCLPLFCEPAVYDKVQQELLHPETWQYLQSESPAHNTTSQPSLTTSPSTQTEGHSDCLTESASPDWSSSSKSLQSHQWSRQTVASEQLCLLQFSEFQGYVLLPYHPIPLFGGVHIKAIIPMGLNPIIDFTVPEYNCYFTGEVLNHNCGKTVSGAYEMALHLTGLYPHWWEGRRFDHAISAWVAGKTNESTRDILQKELLGHLAGENGKKGASGMGMIPKECIGNIMWKAGITGLVDTIMVKHVSGEWSDLGFKTYAQGRDVFEGTKKDVIWFDEEPPIAVYTEALIRTMTTGGMIYTTFTPLEGMTETVMRFLPDGEIFEGINHEKDFAVISMTWDDAPHIDDATKEKMYEVLPPHEKEARSKGRPSMGAGRVYPVPENRIICDPFPIPAFWPQAYGLDVGITKTAAVWGAWDKENDILYITAEYYQGEELPLVHSEAIKAHGDWMNGVIDPASRGRNAATGERLLDIYRNYGLNLLEADNAVDAGTNIVWERLRTGRLKIFSNLPNFFREYRLYRRDEKMKIIKKDDHLMDATRYLCVSGLDVAIMNHAKIEATVFSHLKSSHRKQRDSQNDYDPSSYLS